MEKALLNYEFKSTEDDKEDLKIVTKVLNNKIFCSPTYKSLIDRLKYHQIFHN